MIFEDVSSSYPGASAFQLQANTITAKRAYLNGTVKEYGPTLNLDIGSLKVSQSLQLTDLLTTLKNVIVERVAPTETDKAQDTQKPAYVLVEGKNSIDSLTLIGDTAIYQYSTNGAYEQRAGELSIHSLHLKDGTTARVGGFWTNQAKLPVTGLFDDQHSMIKEADFKVQINQVLLDNGATLATRLNSSTMGTEAGVTKDLHIGELIVDLTANDSMLGATVRINGPLNADKITVITDDLNKKFTVTNDEETLDIVDKNGNVIQNANGLTTEQQRDAAKIQSEAEISIAADRALNDGSMSQSEQLSKVAATVDLGRTELAEGNRVTVSVEENEIQGALTGQAQWDPNATGDDKMLIDTSTITQGANAKTTGIGEIAVVS